MASGAISKLLSKKPGKGSRNGSQAVTPKLDASLVVAKDLKDQGESKYVLLTGAGRPVYYAVDGWDCVDGVMEFWREQPGTRNTVVYVCRKEGSWAVVNRDVANTITEREYVESQHADSKVQEEFYKKLDPEAFKLAEKMAEAGGLEALLNGGGHPHGVKEDGKPVPGQYL